MLVLTGCGRGASGEPQTSQNRDLARRSLPHDPQDTSKSTTGLTISSLSSCSDAYDDPPTGRGIVANVESGQNPSWTTTRVRPVTPPPMMAPSTSAT